MKQLSEGLSAWLMFGFRCGRGRLFSEYYLAHPIGQLLGGHGEHVLAEYPHPVIKSPKGRPIATDFVIMKQDKVPLAIESKWAGLGEPQLKDLIWDAFRLEAFCRHTTGSGLLILAGSTNKIARLLSRKTFRRAGSSVPLLPLPQDLLKRPKTRDRSEYILEWADLSKTVLKHLNKQDEAYPKTIGSNLYCSAPQVHAQGGPKSLSFSVYVWEIRCVPRKAPKKQKLPKMRPQKMKQPPDPLVMECAEPLTV
ncbi:MAG: hypothetical protein IPO88_25285 [Nannocystis sp.]|uniref:hypothetical protein n=1 Tax=Nannocystis sp. TaxID=1962667 RepID=UPI002420D362|nr:hypothetical protein [Nannocystis sp.]MBK9756753.1 hypothetical protein [Nannocystis sp.]